MRFSIKTFLLAVVLVAACCGWFGARYIKRQQEQRILADLEPNIYFRTGLSVSAFFKVTKDPGDELYGKYTDDYLFRLATKYAKVAEHEPSGSISARIAGSALAHLGCSYDLTLEKFIEEPRAVALAEKYYDTNTVPLSSVATIILLRHHRLNEDIHSSQFCEPAFADGFDLDCPIDVYVLVTEIYSEFQHGDNCHGIEENWPIPTHPWQWNLPEAAQHSYQDKIDALQRVSPTSADLYAGMFEILQECDAKPTEKQRQRLYKLSNELREELSDVAIFRFMLKHVDEFKSHPDLRMSQHFRDLILRRQSLNQ